MPEKRGGLLDSFGEGIRLLVMAFFGWLVLGFVQVRDQSIANQVKLDIAYEKMKEIVPREENEKRYAAEESATSALRDRVNAIELYLRQQKKDIDAGFTEKQL